MKERKRWNREFGEREEKRVFEEGERGGLEGESVSVCVCVCV